MKESKTLTDLVDNDQHEDETSSGAENESITIEDSPLSISLGLPKGSILSSKTRIWPDAHDVKLDNGEVYARIEAGMSITLSKVYDPNRNIWKFWFIIDGAISTITRQSLPSELGSDRGPRKWKIRFKDSEGGTLVYFLVDTILGTDESRFHGFRHFCNWNNYPITPRIDLNSCDWFDDFERASHQILGGWIKKCS